MKETDIAYLAGIVDGEGYIGIKKCKAYRCQGRVTAGYHARIQVRMVDEPAIAFLATTLGGWYYRERRIDKNRRPLFCFQASDKKAEGIIASLLPYLRVKKVQAETVLEFLKLKANGRRYRTKVTGQREMPHWTGKMRVKVNNYSYSDEYVALCESFWIRCKQLNRVGTI